MSGAPLEALRASAPGAPELVSGAGHDAMFIAAAGVPAGMLFVRSLNGGISHHPDELSSEEDIAHAVDVLTAALEARLMSEKEVMSWLDLGAGARDLAQAVADDGDPPDLDPRHRARGGLLIAGALGYALGVKNTFTMNVGQNVDSPSAGSYAEGRPPAVGRLRLELAEVRAELMAHGGGLQLGSVLPSAHQGGAERHLEDRDYYGSLKESFTLLAPYGKGVSAKTKSLIAQQKALIESGKWNEFTGPIYDQSGKLRVKKGQRLTSASAAVHSTWSRASSGSQGLEARSAGRGRPAPPCTLSMPAGRRDARHHEAVPRRGRQRQRRLRGGRARSTRCSARTAPARARYCVLYGLYRPTRARSSSTASRSTIALARATPSPPGSG